MAEISLAIRPAHRLLLAGFMAISACAVFMFHDTGPALDFVLRFRGNKLWALLLVAAAVATATLAFQTISHNRILTPEIVGFDALYIFLQTLLVFLLGGSGYSQVAPELKWLLEVGLMLGVVLFLGRLFLAGRASLHLLVLGGFIIGIFFRSASALLQRLINPADFVVLGDSFFASFNQVNSDLLMISSVIVLVAMAATYRLRHELDVLLLGRETSLSLGIRHTARTRQVLLIVTILISISTALVGPVTFLGLLVVHLAYRLAGSHEHRYVMPMAFAVGVLFLVGGEALLQYVFRLETRLGFIVEFIGGIFFITLLLRGQIR